MTRPTFLSLLTSSFVRFTMGAYEYNLRNRACSVRKGVFDYVVYGMRVSGSLHSQITCGVTCPVPPVQASSRPLSRQPRFRTYLYKALLVSDLLLYLLALTSLGVLPPPAVDDSRRREPLDYSQQCLPSSDPSSRPSLPVSRRKGRIGQSRVWPRPPWTSSTSAGTPSRPTSEKRSTGSSVPRKGLESSPLCCSTTRRAFSSLKRLASSYLRHMGQPWRN